jgi:cytochrome c oxidase subunit 1
VEKSLRNLIFWEILIPIILLILGIYHGLMQVLYRDGVVNAIVLTTFFAVAFGNAIIVYFLKRNINLKIAWLSFWLMVIGTLINAYSILIQKTDVLYTLLYPHFILEQFCLQIVMLKRG